MSPVLSARTLYRFFRSGDDETVALRGVSLDVHAGELVAVTGPSGSGKSTLLNCLTGLDEPDGGAVTVEGRRMSHQPEATRSRLRARSVGHVGQGQNLFAHLTVRANLEVVRRWAPRRDREPIEQVLAALGLTHRAAAYPGELSGGEAARAGLAVALAVAPAVVIADEPTGELDSATEREVLDLLVGIARRSAVLVATHSPAVATAADRVVALRDGQVRS